MPLKIVLLAAAAVGGAAPDGQPPRAPHGGRVALADQIGRPEADALLRLSGMSEAGIASLHGAPAAPGAEPRDARCRVQRAATASPLDVTALERALASRDAADAAATAARHKRLIAELKLLAPGDAAVLLKLVGTGDGPGGPGGPPPGPPPAHDGMRLGDMVGPPPGGMRPPPMMQDICGAPA